MEPKNIFVTISHRFSNVPMANKICIVVYPNELTEIQLAKKFRKQCADKNSFNPSELAWAIFDSPDDEKPRIHSDNWHEGILVSVHSFMAIQ